MQVNSLIIAVHDTGYGGYPIKYVATVTLPIKDYTKLKGKLGNLVLDVNNALYKTYGIPAYNPSIDSKGSRRAKDGIKTLVFEYFSKDLLKAKELGMPMFEFKDGLHPKYSETVQLVKDKV